MKRTNQLQSLGLILLLIVTLFSLAFAALTELDEPPFNDSPVEVIAEHGVGDGHLATEVPVGDIVDIATDAAGAVYLADSVHRRVRRVSPEGSIDTVFNSYTQETLSGPRAVAVDDRSGAIFVADALANRVWMIRDNESTAFAGSGVCGFSGDGGPATEAQLHSPSDLAIGADGTVYVADQFNHRIRAIDATGTIRTVIGDPIPESEGSEASVHTRLFQPELIDVGSDGSLYVVDLSGRRLQRIDPDGSAEEIHGLRGTISSISLAGPETLVVASAGALYLVNGREQPVRLTAANEPRVTVIASLGSDLITSTRGEHRVYKITEGNGRTILAGNGTGGRFGDGGSASGATFSCHDVAPDDDGRIFFSDPFNRRIAVIELDGTITTVVGASELQADRPVSFVRPTGLARTADGTLLVADQGAHQVITVALDGTINLVAGSGRPGLAGDGGPATEALLNSPSDVAVNAVGDVFISDQRNRRIRRIDSSGGIATFGTFDGDEPASVAIDKDGNVIVALMGKLEPRILQTSNDTPALSVVHSSGQADRPASGPAGLAIGKSGRLLVASGGEILGPAGNITDRVLTPVSIASIPESVPGMAVSGNDDVVLCDNSRHRILRIRAAAFDGNDVALLKAP